MNRLIFILALALLANIIFLITGRNRRQIKKIPPGMSILCQPPGKRYVLYALGVMVLVFVGFLSVLFVMDGAPEEAIGMWGLCVGMAVLVFVLTIFGGNVMARECTYFDQERIQIERAFRKPKTFAWENIRRIDGGFDRKVNLYLADGTKIFTADISMVNYETFCQMLKVRCPEAVKGYYLSQAYDRPNKRILRYGSEYYVLAVIGLIMLGMYAAALLSSDGNIFLQELFKQRSSFSEIFSVWFAPVYGVVSLIGLFMLCNTNIRYFEEKMTVKFPLRRKKDVYWRNIRRIEGIAVRVNGRKVWKKLRLYTDDTVYKLNVGYLTYGKDDFLAALQKMAKRYEIPWTTERR